MRKILLPVTAGLLALTLAGCTSSSDTAESPAATDTAAATESPAATDTATPADTATAEQIAGCDAANLATYLPEGSVVNQVECATVGDTVWAATLVMEGPTVFYLTRPADDEAAAWQVRTGEEVCGSASAGLPPRLLAFCDRMASATAS